MRRGRKRVRAVFALTVAIGMAAPASGLALSWAPVTGPTSSIQEVARILAPDGTLHVVWTRATPGSSNTQRDIVHIAISPGGAVGTPTVIASGFASANNPSIVNTPGGGLEVLFGGIQCVSTAACPSGLFSATSADGGKTWTPPTMAYDRNANYGSDISATALSDGTTFETWSGTSGVWEHRGLDPALPDYNFQSAIGAGCCGYYSNLAVDAAGHVQLVWDSNATGFLGAWTSPVDPATGAPAGSGLQMPGSVTNYNGAPSHAQMLERTPIVAVPGKAGQFYMAYPGGYPMTTKVLLWRIGDPSSTTIVSEQFDHNEVSLATDQNGRLWIFWARNGTRPDVFARRLGPNGLEPPIDLGAPAGAQSIYALDGAVSPAGDPEALALVGFANSTNGTYYARGPQTAPPENGKTVAASPVSGIVLIKFPGQQVFSQLTSGEDIPVGSTVDATHGRVRLTAALTRKGRTQTGDFYEGAFVMRQRRGQALTTLALSGGNSAICKRRTPDTASTARSSARRRWRLLWASASGSFGTSGRYAAATVRGTIWLTEDDCGGTLIRVRRGTVTVRDLVRHKTIIVHAGGSYFAAR